MAFRARVRQEALGQTQGMTELFGLLPLPVRAALIATDTANLPVPTDTMPGGGGDEGASAGKDAIEGDCTGALRRELVRDGAPSLCSLSIDDAITESASAVRDDAADDGAGEPTRRLRLLARRCIIS